MNVAFFGSAESVDELAVRLAEDQMALMPEENFREFISKRSPRCSEHYFERMERGATWHISRPLLVILFDAVGDRPAYLDYVLGHVDPKPGQKVGLSDLNKGVAVLSGKTMMEVCAWLDGEGLEKQYDMYKR